MRFTFPRLPGIKTKSLLVFAAEPKQISQVADPAGMEFRPLSGEELARIGSAEPAFREMQLKRLERFGASHAYAVFIDGKIAHISWLLPPPAIVRDVPRWLRPKANEAEITGCETLRRYRGKGAYPYAIRKLADVAGRHGITRLYMKTAIDNAASQVGIAKAGFRPIGRVTFIQLPSVRGEIIWRRFTG